MRADRTFLACRSVAPPLSSIAAEREAHMPPVRADPLTHFPPATRACPPRGRAAVGRHQYETHALSSQEEHSHFAHSCAEPPPVA